MWLWLWWWLWLTQVSTVGLLGTHTGQHARAVGAREPVRVAGVAGGVIGRTLAAGACSTKQTLAIAPVSLERIGQARLCDREREKHAPVDTHEERHMST